MLNLLFILRVQKEENKLDIVSKSVAPWALLVKCIVTQSFHTSEKNYYGIRIWRNIKCHNAGRLELENIAELYTMKNEKGVENNWFDLKSV